MRSGCFSSAALVPAVVCVAAAPGDWRAGSRTPVDHGRGRRHADSRSGVEPCARLLPAAALLGGAFLLLVDTLARTLAPVEIPLGILTAIVGTPCFIWLLRRSRQDWS